MTDDIDFNPKPGDVVLDRDDDDTDSAVVVNIPSVTAPDWSISRIEKTIAEDTPDYPDDALVAVDLRLSGLSRRVRRNVNFDGGVYRDEPLSRYPENSARQHRRHARYRGLMNSLGYSKVELPLAENRGIVAVDS